MQLYTVLTVWTLSTGIAKPGAVSRSMRALGNKGVLSCVHDFITTNKPMLGTTKK